MSSKNLAVLGTPAILIILVKISLSAFLVKSSFIKPASLGTNSLNNILPVVVSTISVTSSPFL